MDKEITINDLDAALAKKYGKRSCFVKSITIDHITHHIGLGRAVTLLIELE